MKKPAKNPWRHAAGKRPASKFFFWHKRASKQGDAELAPAAPAARATLLERLWIWTHKTFPERQIYIRSDGRVQFFTFGPSLQATLAGLILIFLGWVAFATVNVVFKDRIITAKDHRYQQMQAAYENRVANLQTSYDELNGALISAEDHFKATADALAAKQDAITGFLNRASQVQAAVGGPANPAALGPATTSVRGGKALAGRVPTGQVDVEAPAGFSSDDGSSQLTVMPGPAQPQPRTARPAKASFLSSTFKRLAALLPSLEAPSPVRPVRDASAAYAKYPVLRVLAGQTARIAHIGESENLLMAKTEIALDRGVGNLRNVMRRAGINPDSFASKIAADHGTGGPEISLDQIKMEGISDPGFAQAYFSAAARLDQLNGLSAALDHVPLTAPVSAASFDKSSSFGARIDPFTGRYAFHTGIDFAGPWGAVVHSTAPGTVVFAGYRGGYGNMVEVDHGFGIHTRYGHLSIIGVRVGSRIDKGWSLGRVGSTGRSTGPHVHYEVWYDDVVKNPTNFIEAGRHVL